jgi:AAHS family 4-hydroxybenzoate transporter-like MFS transporter
MANRAVSVREVFDSTRFTPYQVWVCFLCFSVILLDGFDLTVIGVTLPSIKEFLKSDPSALGIAVGAGQIGPLIGALILGTLADRWGRKRMLIVSAFIFGVFTFLTAHITSVEQLAACRLLAGIGLGGAIPNALAFGCEYAPSRLRASLTTTMWAGMPVGSMIGGLLASKLLGLYGWQSLFMVGGIAPIVVALIAALLLPESLEFLVRQGKDKLRIRKIVSKIAPGLANDERVEIYTPEVQLAGAPVKHLFTEGRAFTTGVLWATFFMSFYLIWILLSWAPTLLKQSGATPQQFSLAFACINLGSAIATITIGRLMDQSNPFRALKLAHVLAFVSFVIFGFFAGSTFVVIAAVSVLTGFFVFGSNSGLVALATVSYPLDIRGSGIGWAYAVGKVGSLLAPVTGGILLSRNWSVSHICTTNAVVALFIAVAVVILQKHLAAAAARKSVEGKAEAEAKPQVA